MMRSCWISLAAVLLILAATNAALAGTTVYTDQGSFLAAVQPGYYLEDFSAFTYGSFTDPSLDFGPINGFEYTMSAADGLYSGDGHMSTNASYDSLDIAFTGSPVTAIGGLFWPTDDAGLGVFGRIALSLSDGTSVSLVGPTPDTFRGFVTDGTAFTSMSISSLEEVQWPTVDNFYVGQAGGETEVVPVPGAFLLGIVCLGCAGRRRRRRKA